MAVASVPKERIGIAIESAVQLGVDRVLALEDLSKHGVCLVWFGEFGLATRHAGGRYSRGLMRSGWRDILQRPYCVVLQPHNILMFVLRSSEPADR